MAGRRKAPFWGGLAVHRKGFWHLESCWWPLPCPPTPGERAACGPEDTASVCALLPGWYLNHVPEWLLCHSVKNWSSHPQNWLRPNPEQAKTFYLVSSHLWKRESQLIKRSNADKRTFFQKQTVRTPSVNKKHFCTGVTLGRSHIIFQSLVLCCYFFGVCYLPCSNSEWPQNFSCSLAN